MHNPAVKHRRSSKMLEALGGSATSPPPIWLMRQAGRYLPEYRAVREQCGGFLELCYSPARAAEVTLQPVQRFDLDAAILFSDILVVPDALGQGVRFLEGEGPNLDPITKAADIDRLDLDRATEKFSLVWETVERVRSELAPDKALIGFCGAPWTVATYMVAGSGSSEQADARLWAYRDPSGFSRLIGKVTEASISYLDGQVRAGADALQIFDSWAGSLPDDEFAKWVVAPTKRIVKEMKARHPDLPIIGFPRGAGSSAKRYAEATEVDAVGCDTAMPLEAMQELGRAGFAVQGNLDPLLLVAGGEALKQRIAVTLNALAGLPHVFNLGHGIVPQTPPEHVALLVECVRGAQPSKLHGSRHG